MVEPVILYTCFDWEEGHFEPYWALLLKESSISEGESTLVTLYQGGIHTIRERHLFHKISAHCWCRVAEAIQLVEHFAPAWKRENVEKLKKMLRMVAPVNLPRHKMIELGTKTPAAGPRSVPKGDGQFQVTPDIFVEALGPNEAESPLIYIRFEDYPEPQSVPVFADEIRPLIDALTGAASWLSNQCLRVAIEDEEIRKEGE